MKTSVTFRSGQTKRAFGRWLVCAVVFGAVGLGWAAERAVTGVQTNDAIRIGLSPGVWSDVSQNDASAAIKVWVKTVLQQRKMSAPVESAVFDTDRALTEALHGRRVDAVTLLTPQFLALEPSLRPESVYLSVNSGSIAERYVLLTHRATGLTNLPSLRGRRVVLQSKVRANLAPIWFETALAQASMEPNAVQARLGTSDDKPAKLVMDVFFQKVEACLVTSNVFALTCELNPQLRQKLQVIAISPELVPTVFFFRADYRSPLREELEPAILGLQQTPAGQQVLTVFQTERMTKNPVSSLQSVSELLELHRQLVKPHSPPANPVSGN